MADRAAGVDKANHEVHVVSSDTTEGPADLPLAYTLSDVALANLTDDPFKDFTLRTSDGDLEVECNRGILARSSAVLR